MSLVTLNPDSLKQWQDENLEHLRYEYDLKSTDLVLDIGSYRREFADQIERRYYCTVECFEALDDRAAWVFDGTIKMGGAFYYSSIYEPGEQIHKCVDIAPFLQREVALMKTNIEGGEYALLRYMIDKGLHTNVRNFQVQFHEIEDEMYQTWYAQLAEDLSKTHSLTWRYPFCWENWERKASPGKVALNGDKL